MRERNYDKNLPIQGNYYPVAASTFIQSQTPAEDGAGVRFTVLSHQAHGVGSLSEGQLGLYIPNTQTN